MVPKDKYYGAMTARSLKNFDIGGETEKMPVSECGLILDYLSFDSQRTPSYY